MSNIPKFISLVKRENNVKRPYLVLNREQAKHFPSNPTDVSMKFDNLAKKVRNEVENEKILIIGFAETATAIGSWIANELNSIYMQTTRESLDDANYIQFREEHSHSIEQKIIKEDLDKVINDITGILFAEDEITTGNTILNGISAIKRAYPNNKLDFYVASILSCMSAEHTKRFENNSIKHYFLEYFEAVGFEEIVAGIPQIPDSGFERFNKENFSFLKFNANLNIRRLHKSSQMENLCNELISSIDTNIENQNVLVLGTEEFMYPAICLAKKLEACNNVLCHATTRSPIAPSDVSGYAIQSRHKLRSLYDIERKTFVYNLAKYDEVFIISDAILEDNLGLDDLLSALSYCGNKKITIVEWIANA